MIRTKILLMIASLLLPLSLAPVGVVHADTSGELGSGVNAAGGGTCGDASKGQPSCQSVINGKIASVVNILSSLVGVVAVIMIIIGGFRYITSAGDSNRVSSAKNTIIYALIGLVIVALAQVIVQFVLKRVT